MAINEMYYSTDTEDVTVIFNGALTTAWVTHNLSGLTAKAHAKHHEEDVYNQVYGSDLAIARAKSRLYNKIQKRLTKGLV